MPKAGERPAALAELDPADPLAVLIPLFLLELPVAARRRRSASSTSRTPSRWASSRTARRSSPSSGSCRPGTRSSRRIWSTVAVTSTCSASRPRRPCSATSRAGSRSQRALDLGDGLRHPGVPARRSTPSRSSPPTSTSGRSTSPAFNLALNGGGRRRAAQRQLASSRSPASASTSSSATRPS